MTNPTTTTSATAGVPETTDDARRFLVEWHRANWKHAPFFGNYISTELAGDFAFHLARWLAQPRVAEQADPITCTVDGEVMSPLEYIAHLHDQLNARQAAPEAPAEQKPVARLHEEISDRPYTEGKPYFEITILDRKRCFDGMELYAEPAPATVASPEDTTTASAPVQAAQPALPAASVTLEYEGGSARVISLNGAKLRTGTKLYLAAPGAAQTTDAREGGEK